MQEIHSIGGGRFLGGSGEDRRLRTHPHQNHQALKCPRCDSLNTKFCYYNNYNLSQPRHFCKNCRRYWTKGGVLRNVPVGGGCRKSKRSNKPKNNSSSSSETHAAATPPSQPPEPERKSNSHSSSESSSLTAAAATEAVSATTANSASNNNKLLDNIQESKSFIHHQSSSHGFELQEQGVGDCGIFSEIGSFTSLITSNNEALTFGFGNNVSDASPFRFGAQHGTDPHAQCQWQQQKVMSINGDHALHQDFKLPGIAGGSLLDPTAPVELSALQNKGGHGHAGFGPLDWHTGQDQGLFDLPNTVDQAYWTHTHWSDQDNPTLFHLP